MSEGEAAARLDALLKANEGVVQLQQRAANVSSGRAAEQCAVTDKPPKRPLPEPDVGSSDDEPSRFTGTMAEGWGMFSTSSASSASSAPPQKKKSKAAKTSGHGPNYAELAQVLRDVGYGGYISLEDLRTDVELDYRLSNGAGFLRSLFDDAG